MQMLQKFVSKECAICSCKPAIMNRFSYHPICEKHWEQFNACFHPEIAQLKLGLIPHLPEKFDQCVICNSKLTPNEKENLDANQINVTCEKHSSVKHWAQLDMSKFFFEYQLTHPEVTVEMIDYTIGARRDFGESFENKLREK